MDHRELINRSRALNKYWGAHYDQEFSKTLQNVTDALEETMAERDAAVEELRGICWCCANGKPMGRIGRLRSCTTCDYMAERGMLGVVGREKDCPHWRWRGPQKEGGEQHVG